MFGGGDTKSTPKEDKEAAAAKAEQDIFNRSKMLQSLFQRDPGVFNGAIRDLLNKGDKASKDTIVTAYRLIGHGNAPVLKKWGLI